eukprot:COSAG01_NODE_719_length_14073_cov_30.141906_14_plen_93_part_01
MVCSFCSRLFCFFDDCTAVGNLLASTTISSSREGFSWLFANHIKLDLLTLKVTIGRKTQLSIGLFYTAVVNCTYLDIPRRATRARARAAPRRR